MGQEGGGLVIRDWTLPSWWAARTSPDEVFAQGRLPLFEDPWGVLAPPGGAVTVAVCTAPVPTGRPHRHPPTLLLERRRLRGSVSEARRRIAEPPPAASGGTGGVDHRPVPTRYGTAPLLLSRPWGVRTGPDVRGVAVLIPPDSADAVVLTVTWDDEHGMDTLVDLVRHTLDQLTLVVESEQPEPTTQAHRLASGDAAFPPARWVGVRNAGAAGAAGRWVTGAAHRIVGRSGYGRACGWVWALLAALVVAVWALAGTSAGAVVTGAVVATACVLPVLLAWRAWTWLYGLVSDPQDWTSRAPPDQARPVGIWSYLATAGLLGIAMFGSLVSGSHVRGGWMLTAWVAAHAVLLLLDHLRIWAAHLRRRRLSRLVRG